MFLTVCLQCDPNPAALQAFISAMGPCSRCRPGTRRVLLHPWSQDTTSAACPRAPWQPWGAGLGGGGHAAATLAELLFVISQQTLTYCWTAEANASFHGMPFHFPKSSHSHIAQGIFQKRHIGTPGDGAPCQTSVTISSAASSGRPTVAVTRFYMRIILEETKLPQAAGLHPKGTSLEVGHWWSWRHRWSAGGTLPLREAWAWPLQGPPCP